MVRWNRITGFAGSPAGLADTSDYQSGVVDGPTAGDHLEEPPPGFGSPAGRFDPAYFKDFVPEAEPDDDLGWDAGLSAMDTPLASAAAESVGYHDGTYQGGGYQQPQPWAGADAEGSMGFRQPVPDTDDADYEQNRYLDSFEPETLPQRIPSEPDVPPVVDNHGAALTGSLLDQDATAGDGSPLARIASYLRHERDTAAAGGREDEFNISAVMTAVRDVPGVNDAVLRTSPGGVHTLRLELADGADAGMVSRAVARLINERLGLNAERTEPASASPAPADGAEPLALASAEPADSRDDEPYTWTEDSGAQPMPITSLTRPGLGLVGPTDDRTRRRQAMAALRARTGGESRVNANEARSASARAAVRQVLPAGGSEAPLSRVIVDEVQLTTLGVDATVEVRLVAGARRTVGVASGPAVDGYMVRLAAVAAAAAIDELLAYGADAAARARCFVEHAGIISFGSCEVAVVVLWLSESQQPTMNREMPHIEQLAGSAVVGGGDPRQAVVRATLAAMNRRLEALLP
jgi:hypothetical protein